MLRSGTGVKVSDTTNLGRDPVADTQNKKPKTKKLQTQIMKSIKTFFILSIAIIVGYSARAQVITTNTISLEAAKKVVAEAVKYAPKGIWKQAP